MKRIIICFIIACSVFTLHAKTWKVIGEALDSDTTLLVQDAANTSVYKYIGNLKNKSFKLFDGVDTFIPVCGMNDPFEQQIGMEKQTALSQAGFRVSYVNPNSIYRITLTDGSAPKIIAEKVVPYDKIYLIGGPVNTNVPNWLLRDARELEKDPANPFVFYYRGFLKYNTAGDERGSIKFLTTNTNWNPGFHPAGSTNVPLAQASKMRLGGIDSKWEIPADGSGNGYYVIKLNTLDETIKVEQFQHANVDYPNNIYITGDAMPCGWVNGDPMVMTPTNILEGKYSWTGNVVPGQFKILKVKNTWGSCYVSTIRDQPVEFGKLYPIVYEFEYFNNGGNDFKFVITEAAKCTFNVDLAAMKISVHKETQSSTGSLKQNDEVFINARDGKIVVSSSTDLKKNVSVFTVDGRKIHNKSFVSHFEVRLPKGYYIVKVTDSKGSRFENSCILN